MKVFQVKEVEQNLGHVFVLVNDLLNEEKTKQSEPVFVVLSSVQCYFAGLTLVLYIFSSVLAHFLFG